MTKEADWLVGCSTMLIIQGNIHLSSLKKGHAEEDFSYKFCRLMLSAGRQPIQIDCYPAVFIYPNLMLTDQREDT